MKKTVNVLVSFFSFWFMYYLLAATKRSIIMNLMVFGIFVINILLFVVDEYERRMTAQRCELAVRVKELENSKDSVEQIRERHIEIEKRNHDFGKTVLLIYDLLEQEKYAEAKELVNSLRENGARYIEHTIYSSNAILNTLLNRKLEQCRKNGIDAKCYICGAVDGVDELDMYYLFANLLDNAVNAASGSEKPYISVQINGSHEKIYGEIANSIRYTEKEKFEELVPEVFPAGHGYGLKNIREIVERNGGNIDYLIVNPKLLKVKFDMLKNVGRGGEFC